MTSGSRYSQVLKGTIFLAVIWCFLGAAFTARAEVVDKVIVVVNDEVVTQKELDRVYEPLKKQYEQALQGDELAARLEQLHKSLLEQLVDAKLVISLAKKAKVTINEEELKKRIDKIKSYYPSEEEFNKALNERGTNVTELEKDLREQMLAQELVGKEVASKIVITPGEIKELYDKNKEKLVSPKRAKVKGIMVRKQDQGDAAAEKKKAEDILKKLKAGGDFAAIAKEQSEGPYAAEGGEMGYVSPGQMVKEIDDQIFVTKDGGITEIIETSIGYHIFLVEKVEEPRALELTEVSEFLRQQLYMKKFQDDLVKWIEGKKKNAYISFKEKQQ